MAIDELLDEHEQSERVRDWLRRNGAGIVGGVLLGLALVGGWKWWQAQQQAQRMQAGEAYESMLEQLEAGNLKQAQARTAELGQGAYSTLAALSLAKTQVDSGDRDAAIATLRGIDGAEPLLSGVVDQRLARLLVDAGKHAEALQRLAGADDAASLEIRGDAQAALGKPEEARKAYTDALTRLDVAAPQRRLIEIKLTDVGGAPAQPEART
jgi:predicted negative regulator of RcsB-dependent stress response